MAGLIDAAVQTRRLEAMQAAMRVDVINLAVDYAMRSADAFTAPSLSPARRARPGTPRGDRRAGDGAAPARAHHDPARLRGVDPRDRAPGDAGGAPGRRASTRRTPVSSSTRPQGSPRRRFERASTPSSPTAPRSTTAASLRRIARRLRESAQAETLAERHERARAERRVELEPARDGMAWLHLHLAADDAMLIRDRLDRVAADVRDDASGASAPAEGRRGSHARPAPCGCRAGPAPARRAAGRRGVPRRGGDSHGPPCTSRCRC